MTHLVFHDSSSSDLLRRTQTPKTNMKCFIVLAALVAVALADVSHLRQQPKDIQLTREIPSDNIGLDTYRFAYEQSDGQTREETAKVEVGKLPEEGTLRVKGSYSFVGDDGQTYTVNYIADENGFQPEAAHLPVAPVA